MSKSAIPPEGATILGSGPGLQQQAFVLGLVEEIYTTMIEFSQSDCSEGCAFLKRMDGTKSHHQDSEFECLSTNITRAVVAFCCALKMTTALICSEHKW